MVYGQLFHWIVISFGIRVWKTGDKESGRRLWVYAIHFEQVKKWKLYPVCMLTKEQPEKENTVIVNSQNGLLCQYQSFCPATNAID